MSDSRRGAPGTDDEPSDRGGGSDAPTAGTGGEAPAVTILAATARASTAYTASAAQSAATALVRMFFDQGVLSPSLWQLPEASGTVPAPVGTADPRTRRAALEQTRAAAGAAPEDDGPDGRPASCTDPVRAA